MNKIRRSNRFFKLVDKHPRHVESGLARDFPKTGGTGHVHFGQPVTDNVEPDKEQSPFGQNGRQCFGYLPVAFRQRLRPAEPARRQIATDFAILRDSRQSKGNKLSIDQQYPFIPPGDLGNIFLHHDGFMTVFRQRFNNGAEIDAIYTDTKNTRTAIAFKGFKMTS